MNMSNRAKSALATAGLTVAEDSAIAQLAAFAAQNSGIDPRNYYDPADRLAGRRQVWLDGCAAYRAEARSISEDWRRFKSALVMAAAEGVTDSEVIAAAPGAFSGRLSWGPKQHHNTKNGEYSGEWSYCSGQYWPTEYRKASASVMEAAIRAVRQARPADRRAVSSIGELRALNERNGGCWFEAGAKRFFGTRIESGIIRGRYFVTSEQPPHGTRAYSVRSFDDKGDVGTVGEFCHLPSKAAAVALIGTMPE
jgi:hypothetical protein